MAGWGLSTGCFCELIVSKFIDLRQQPAAEYSALRDIQENVIPPLSRPIRTGDATYRTRLNDGKIVLCISFLHDSRRCQQDEILDMIWSDAKVVGDNTFSQRGVMFNDMGKNYRCELFSR